MYTDHHLARMRTVELLGGHAPNFLGVIRVMLDRKYGSLHSRLREPRRLDLIHPLFHLSIRQHHVTKHRSDHRRNDDHTDDNQQQRYARRLGHFEVMVSWQHRLWSN